MVNYYKILDVPEDAAIGQIKAAFKKKAVIFHPDKNPGDPQMEERFKEINRAYQVLTNPYEKARHDLQLKYGGYYAPPEDYHYQPPPPPPPGRRGRYRYAAREINWKENMVATAYAFGFTFIVAAIVMTGIGIKTYIDNEKLEALLAERREIYEDARQNYRNGNFEASLASINSLEGFFDSEEDIAAFREELIDLIEARSLSHFGNSEFQEAIFYFELLENYTDVKALRLKEKLAIAYLRSNQPRKSVHVFTQLLMLGYKSLHTYVQLAEIHRDELQDLDASLMYFERANKVAKEYYASLWGPAYLVTLRGEQLSEVHWDLYTGLAEMYLLTDDPAMALSATRWNIQVWPNRVENYLIASEGAERLNQIQRSCDFHAMARRIDPTIPVKSPCL